MHYQEFPIVDVALRCGVPLDDSTLRHEEVEASCPFCGDNGPGKYHLSLNTKKNQYRCNLCGATGNSVTLYARLQGVSNRTAAEDLAGGSNVYQLPAAPAPRKEKPEQEPKSLAERDEVYRAMLAHLALDHQHRADLTRRGLTDERIAANEYRSMPQTEDARRRLAAMLSAFHGLDGIPGFYTPRDQIWSLYGKPGLLIPVRDTAGLIQGFQIRLDEEANPKRKYRWLSSRYQANGTRSYSWLHVTGNRKATTAYLTEGGLKGDVASFLDRDALFLCLSGVNALDGLTEVLHALHLEELVVVLDMDKVYNPNVQAALERIAKIAGAIPGLHLRMPNWNPAFKGVDDYFYAKAKGYRPRRYQPTPISNYLDSIWAKEFPTCDREFISLCQWEEADTPLTALKCAEPTKPEDLGKVEQYRQALRDGAIPFPPLVCINGDVAEGRHRYWAYRMEGYDAAPVLQNRPPMLVA